MLRAYCHSTRARPIRARLSSSLLLPAEALRRGGEISLFLLVSLSPSEPLTVSARLYNGERGNAGGVCAVLERHGVCGDGHPEDWHVPVRLSERRPDPGRGRRWNLQSAVPAQTRVLLRLPVLTSICKFTSSALICMLGTLRKLCNQSVKTFCRRSLQLLDIFMERFISMCKWEN